MTLRFEFVLSGHMMLDDDDVDMLVTCGVDINDPVAIGRWFDGLDYLQYVENHEYTIVPYA